MVSERDRLTDSTVIVSRRHGCASCQMVSLSPFLLLQLLLLLLLLPSRYCRFCFFVHFAYELLFQNHKTIDAVIDTFPDT